MTELRNERKLGPGPARNGPTCGHTNPMQLRLISYTRYGPMIGCLECGASWLIRDSS